MPPKKETAASANANATANAMPQTKKAPAKKGKPVVKAAAKAPRPEGRVRIANTQELKECKKVAYGAWRSACDADANCIAGLQGSCKKDLDALPAGVNWQTMWGHMSKDPVESKSIRNAQRCVMKYTWDNPSLDFGKYYNTTCADQIARAMAKTKVGGAAKKKKVTKKKTSSASAAVPKKKKKKSVAKK